MPQIQEAINQVVFELASYPTLNRDIIISVGPGTFKPFRIPDGSLLALLNSSYRLIIKSSGSHFPVIDFNIGAESQVIGADIGSGNPNVTIEGLRFQYFAVGIRSATNSHFVKIKNCILDNNRNCGLLIEQCDQAQILQNIVVNGDFGIVGRLCKDIAIIHNTVFMNGAISTTEGKSNSGLWLQLALDYGGGLSDSGRLYILGNIVWNITGRCLTLIYEDVERDGAIISNFNDFVSGDRNDYIALLSYSFARMTTKPKATFTTLSSWKTTTGLDGFSINQDPRFIAPVKLRSDKNGYAIDLTILPVSPVLGIVPSFFVNANARDEYFPNFVDSSDLSRDIIGQNRTQNGTSAGANDKASTFSFYGQDILSNPLELGLEKDCAVDPLFNLLNKEIDIWYPKLTPGYFYSYEREYYLYGKKECKFLGELAVTEFDLFQKSRDSYPIKLFVRGTEIEEPTKYIAILGTKLFFFHKDLFIFSREQEIEILLISNEWKNDQFYPVETTYVFKIKEGKTRYLLPDNYVAKGPVVITDDLSFPTDSDLYSNREFSVSFNDQFGQSEIKFANDSNIVNNAQFDYFVDSPPREWAANNALVEFGGSGEYSAFGGFNCAIHPTGYISQRQPLTTGEYTLSWHAYNRGSGELQYTIDFYDANNKNLGYTQTGFIQPTKTWNRYYVSFGLSGDPYPQLVENQPFPTTFVDHITPPNNLAFIRFNFSSQPHPIFTGAVLVDGVQLETGIRPTLFHRNPYFNELTVEYETTEEDFIDRRLAISPVRNLKSDGFLYIPEISPKEYNGPDVAYASTLHDWKWPEGRIKVMPWARTKGKDKLRKRSANYFNRLPQDKPDVIAPVVDKPFIDYTRLVPSEPLARQGDKNGIGISLQCVDSNGNPHANQIAKIFITTPKYNFPGYLAKKYFGLKEMLDQNIVTLTDNVGSVGLIWIPPPIEQTLLVTDIPLPSETNDYQERIAVIETPYPVSLAYHGNVTILDSTNTPISTSAATAVTNSYVPVYSNGFSKVKLRYPIVPGSVAVVANNKVLQPSAINQLNTDQFFIDYENSIITVKGRFSDLTVTYTPSYIFVNQTDNHKIAIYYDKVFGNITGPITVGYDIVVTLTALINDNVPDQYVTEVYELIAQNSLISQSRKVNTQYLEI